MVKQTFIFSICLVLFASQASAILYPDRNIEVMAQQAHHIFVGQVTQQMPEQKANGLWGITTTLTVLEDWTNNTPATFSFTQLAQKAPKGDYHVFHGFPVFQKGQMVLLMLPQASAQGFSSPIDLQAFMVLKGKTGDLTQAKVWPMRKAAHLFDNLQTPANQSLLQQKGWPTNMQSFVPLNLSTLKTMVKESRL
jgi:hypothetical protein